MKISKLLTGAAFLFASAASFSAPINVGGVVWDPDQQAIFPGAEDYFMSGGIIEDVAINPGDIVNGYGSTAFLNQDPTSVPNPGAFCPGCELTFTFSMELVSFTPTGGTSGDFIFKDLSIQFYVDHSQNYDGTAGTAGDGTLWLDLLVNGFLTGSGDDLGTGSDQGAGSALLDVVGGLAASNFDTNQEANGADLVLSSSFQPSQATSGPTVGKLVGTWEITGNSIPEPASLALLGLGLLGLAGFRRKA